MDLVWGVGTVTFMTGLGIGGYVVSSIRAVWESQRMEAYQRELLAQHAFFVQTQMRIIDAIGLEPDLIERATDEIEYAELHADCEVGVDEYGYLHHHCDIPEQ